MNNKIRLWTVGVLAVLLAATALLFFFNREKWPDYRDYLDGGNPAIDMRYDRLTTATDEKAARKHFPTVFLRCSDESSVAHLGSRVCYSDLTGADGLPAMNVLLLFAKGKLTHTMLRVPWWHHGAWRERLVSQYGKAHRSTTFSALEGPMVQWDLPGGARINFHRDRSLNPLQWSGIFFTPADPPASPPAADAAQQAAPPAPVAPDPTHPAPRVPAPFFERRS
ncbi:MAG: hypothetical protein JWQ72_1100 [Polaromonas sp.]|nr:hypothetical protein [Polaromonas sp.]